jgi:hypothetical protein
VLRLSEDAAYNRIKAARAARLYPEIVGMLADGSLSTTTVRLLAPHLTPENHEKLLAAASTRGKQEVEELLARWFPRPDVAPLVRKIPNRRVAAQAAVSPGDGARETDLRFGSSARASPVESGAAPVMAAATPKPPLVRPLATDRYEVRFTADGETRRLLREAQDLLGHALPSGDLAAVFHRALVVLVTDLKRRKFGATSRPRPVRVSKTGSRTSGAAVRREVGARDANRCAFVSKDGHRCGETRFLEFHHVVPHAVGGRATAENIQLRCRAHNGHEVDLFFGPGKRRVKDRAGKEASSTVTRSGTGGWPLRSG